MAQLLSAVFRTFGLVVRMPSLLIEYKLKKRRFLNQFSDTIDVYPFTEAQKKELRHQLEEISLVKLAKEFQLPSQ